MNFQRGREKEPLEINLVPLIDVMMVILIFLMITTTYNRYAELAINLPSADAERQPERAGEPHQHRRPEDGVPHAAAGLADGRGERREERRGEAGGALRDDEPQHGPERRDGGDHHRAARDGDRRVHDPAHEERPHAAPLRRATT
jgi:hypothetical protein